MKHPAPKVAVISPGSFLAALGLALALCVMAPGGARAAGNIFTVSGVHVDVTADTVTAARDIARAQGQREALRRLLRRLTLRKDWLDLPDAGGNELNAMIVGFEVRNEKSSANRYIADLTVRFRPNAVRNLLRTYGISFSEIQARPVLLIPTLFRPEGAVLWEEDNPWREAWIDLNLDNSLTPIIVPIGDLQDMLALDAETVKDADWQRLSGFTARYGVEEVWLADAVYDGAGGPVSVTLRQVREGTSNQLSLTVGPEDLPLPETESDAAAVLDAVEEDPLPDLLALAAARMSAETEEAWKSETIVSAAEDTVIEASVPFQNMGEWLRIRQRLERVPVIRGMEIIALSSDGAYLRLDLAGTPDRLATGLAQRDLDLWQAAGVWTIGFERPAFIETTAPAGMEPSPYDVPPAGDAAPAEAGAPQAAPQADPYADAPYDGNPNGGNPNEGNPNEGNL